MKNIDEKTLLMEKIISLEYKQNYDLDYSLCDVDNIIPTWQKLSENYANKGYPYEVKNNCGQNWTESCKYCYYKFNNKILHTVAQEMPDRNFP